MVDVVILILNLVISPGPWDPLCRLVWSHVLFRRRRRDLLDEIFTLLLDMTTRDLLGAPAQDSHEPGWPLRSPAISAQELGFLP